ncbi:helix-turn-helix transcriptional regulator [Flavobacterium sp. DG1-102-2]|uniref:AraC family transcriptional regulator n=1 Tax=Flavobacterium sp. DG1-102-2 TaxID=3081663 RepID=UPI002949BBF3|nr:helix-turn-helix transcriptional regulator [Flavobacterium sp. DG1-102-2]MDV6168497.1 helix-turn-helix transcriptional regulator [Flavobacterium sp. DG1-102-2]
MKTIKNIPIHKQDASAVGGINLQYMTFKDMDEEMDITASHMDDYYIFLVAQKGSADFHLDMEDFELKAPGLIMVRPFQVHAPKSVSIDMQGYFMSVESFLVPDYCREIFENLMPQKQFFPFQEESPDLIDTLSLIHRTFNSDNPFKASILNGLLSGFLNQAAGLYFKAGAGKPQQKSQAAIITAKFKTLLKQYSFLHLPSFYAKQLNITTSHLNHCLNTATGLSVTHWLQDAMIIEAKKQIYYTNNDIKEIAFLLGYEDHAYFSRLFKKITGETPLAFRKKFRE